MGAFPNGGPQHPTCEACICSVGLIAHDAHLFLGGGWVASFGGVVALSDRVYM
jgi:hypothetical protein